MSTPNPAQPDRPAAILARGDGATIAYHRRTGKSPGVVFLGGFMSDMTGTKARTLDAFCAARGQAYLRFDYFGHGASSGAFADATIGRWKEDALAAIDQLTDGPQVLVGSSLGGWLMLLAALARPARIAGAGRHRRGARRHRGSDVGAAPRRSATRSCGLGDALPSEYSPDGYLFTRS